MATKYFCDRCKKEQQSRTDLFDVSIPVNERCANAREYELCQNCLTALVCFIRETPPTAE